MPKYTKMTIKEWKKKYSPDQAKRYPVYGWEYRGTDYTDLNPYHNDKGPHYMAYIKEVGRWAVCAGNWDSGGCCVMTFSDRVILHQPKKIRKQRGG